MKMKNVSPDDVILGAVSAIEYTIVVAPGQEIELSDKRRACYAKTDPVWKRLVEASSPAAKAKPAPAPSQTAGGTPTHAEEVEADQAALLKLLEQVQKEPAQPEADAPAAVKG